MSAQVAHIHALPFTRSLTDVLTVTLSDALTKDDFNDWFHEPYIFVKQVPNGEALNHFKGLAEAAGVYVAEWRDTVYVRLSKTMKQAFSDVAVGICLGPDNADKIRTIVGDLPLL